MRKYVSLAYNDEELYDHSKGMPSGYKPSEYPSGLCFSIGEEDMEQADAGGKPGATMRFSAMGTVTSVFKGLKDNRIELELKQFAGEDGQFFDLSSPVSICLCNAELEKLDITPDFIRGDTFHLIGTARLESTSDSDMMGEMACLQVIELALEDESSESREG